MHIYRAIARITLKAPKEASAEVQTSGAVTTHSCFGTCSIYEDFTAPQNLLVFNVVYFKYCVFKESFLKAKEVLQIERSLQIKNVLPDFEQATTA